MNRENRETGELAVAGLIDSEMKVGEGHQAETARKSITSLLEGGFLVCLLASTDIDRRVGG